MNTDRNEMINEAADLIISAAKFSAVAGMLAADMGVNLSASLQLNIRDAMFHFVAMKDYMDDTETNEFEVNYYNLKEHISRGKKDAVILFSQDVCNAVMDEADTAIYEGVSFEDRKQIQHHCHEIKNTVLRIRIAGGELSKKEKFQVENAWDKVVQNTRCIVKIFRRYDLELFKL